ncbi:MAG: radical SAM protein [Coriobacteriaceae bacterium]|nr:radical SAM protein [Coriobacteriaceae bacterium]
MADEEFNLVAYLNEGVEDIVKRALRATLPNAKESAFLAAYALASRRFARLRQKQEAQGVHVPAFLIASITSSCNLPRVGRYSTVIDFCNDCPPADNLSDEAWGTIFQESASLGIGFIVLAGGEPLLRRDVLLQAASFPDVVFPVITDGSLFSDEYLQIFDQNRNLVPILSLMSPQVSTGSRGDGDVHQRLDITMRQMKELGILFGAFVTVTTQNIHEALSEAFVEELYAQGCRILILVEYMAPSEGTEYLAPDADDRLYLEERLDSLRATFEDMIFLAFPGEEKVAGGCLAGGRGFIHINSRGDAEPCPFSPHSGINVQEVGVAGALQSELFRALREGGLLTNEDGGGCVLFKRDAQVLELMNAGQMRSRHAR